MQGLQSSFRQVKTKSELISSDPISLPLSLSGLPLGDTASKSPVKLHEFGSRSPFGRRQPSFVTPENWRESPKVNLNANFHQRNGQLTRKGNICRLIRNWQAIMASSLLVLCDWANFLPENRPLKEDEKWLTGGKFLRPCLSG